MTRLQMALAAYVALAVLVWTTISDERIRFATLAILAMFAVKTWVRRKDVMHREEPQDAGDAAVTESSKGVEIEPM